MINRETAMIVLLAQRPRHPHDPHRLRRSAVWILLLVGGRAWHDGPVSWFDRCVEL